mgnify:CR=1 FL=1
MLVARPSPSTEKGYEHSIYIDGKHGIEGGNNWENAKFVPGIAPTDLDSLRVTTEQAFAGWVFLVQQGIEVGISSGAAFFAAVARAKANPASNGKENIIVVIAPDGLSSYENTWQREAVFADASTKAFWSSKFREELQLAR